MASIHERNGRFRIRYRIKGKKNPLSYTTPKGTTRREAEKLAREIQLEIDKTGFWAPASAAPTDLEDLVDRYIAERTRGTPGKPAARPKTLHQYEVVLRNLLLSHCRGKGTSAPGLYALNRDTISALLSDKRDSGRTPSTLSAYARTIRAFWTWAARKQPKHMQPVDMPHVHTPPAQQVLAPTWDEIDLMVGQLTSRAESVRRAALVMRYTGLRIGQVAGLTWGDFDDDWEGLGPAMHIRVAKTEAEAAMNRRVPLATPLAQVLRVWKMKDWRTGEDDPIIGTLPRDPHTTTREAWKRAGVPEERWRGHPNHAIRKRFISHLMERDVTERAIDYLVGHAPRGIQARHYIDPRAYWPHLRDALAEIPPLDAEIQAAIGL